MHDKESEVICSEESMINLFGIDQLNCTYTAASRRLAYLSEGKIHKFVIQSNKPSE
jgi:hypothetical protein